MTSSLTESNGQGGHVVYAYDASGQRVPRLGWPMPTGLVPRPGIDGAQRNSPELLGGFQGSSLHLRYAGGYEIWFDASSGTTADGGQAAGVCEAAAAGSLDLGGVQASGYRPQDGALVEERRGDSSFPLELVEALALLMWRHRDRSGIAKVGEYVELRTPLWRARVRLDEIDRVVLRPRMSTVFVRRRGTWRSSQTSIGRRNSRERREDVEALREISGVDSPSGPEVSVEGLTRLLSASEAFLRYPRRTLTWHVTPSTPRAGALFVSLGFLAGVDGMCWLAYLLF